MTRPSRHQDQLLIDTARRLLPETGVSGMSLKRVADECGVNLGMFHYHFKTKTCFVRKVLESINEEIQRELEAGALEGATSVDRLRSAILAVAYRMIQEKKILVSMMRDLLNGDEEVSGFVARVHEQRLRTIGPLIEDCRREGRLVPLPTAQILAFLMCSVSFPTLIVEALERAPVDALQPTKAVREALASREAVRQRVDLAVKAICQEGVPV